MGTSSILRALLCERPSIGYVVRCRFRARKDFPGPGVLLVGEGERGAMMVSSSLGSCHLMVGRIQAVRTSIDNTKNATRDKVAETRGKRDTRPLTP